MSDYAYTSPPPSYPPQSSPPPPGDDCGTTLGFNLTLVDPEANNLSGTGLLPTAQLVKLDLGGTSAEIGNPLAPECADQQTHAVINLDVSQLPTDVLSDTGLTGDLLHLALGEASARIGSPFASEAAGEDAAPLIDISAQSFPLDAFGGSGGEDGGTRPAGLLDSGAAAAETATSLLSSLLATGDRGGGEEDCGCGGILEPVLDLALNSVDVLVA